MLNNQIPWEYSSFNSRARVGATLEFEVAGDGDDVSIHAPGWARQVTAAATTSEVRFQFTRPGGRDGTAAVMAENAKLFQFTRPGGRDESS